MKCINCNQEFKSKREDARFCSDRCRKAHARIISDNKSDIISDKQEIKSDKQPDIISDTIISDKPYKIIKGQTVYHRQAVQFPDEEQGTTNSQGATWTTRPEPEHATDTPDKDNRGVYKRKNKSTYLIDAVGSIIEREDPPVP